MNKKTKNLIIRHLRKASLASEERREAKKLAKVAPATWQCAICDIMVYCGAKELNKAGLESFPNKIKGKVHMDHKQPVRSVYDKKFNWNDYITSLFSPVENWQCLCEKCHEEKTEKENVARNKNKKKNRRKNAKTEKINKKTIKLSKKNSKAKN